MLRLRAVDHIGIVVTDLDRSLRFYQALGVELVRLPRRPGGATVLKAGWHGNQACSATRTRRGRAAVSELDHLCLEMDAAAMDDIVAALAAAQITPAGAPVPRSDGTALFVLDPDGARIELLVKHER